MSGSVLFPVLSLLHPPLFDPRAAEAAVSAILAEPAWEPLHWGLAVAILQLGLGLLTLHVLLSERGARYSPFAAAAALISTTLWMLIFVAEAAGGVPLARAFVPARAGPDALSPATQAVAGVVTAAWSATLAIGYAAAALLGLSALLWSLDLCHLNLFSPWIGRLGLIAGALMTVAQPLGWLWPELGLLLVVPPAILFMAWTIWLGWLLWPRARATTG